VAYDPEVVEAMARVAARQTPAHRL